MSLAAVYTSLRALLVADSAVVSALALGASGIYEEGAAAVKTANMPFLTIGAGTRVPFQRFQTVGWNCTVQVKVVTQGTESSGEAIRGLLSLVLYPGRPITVAGFTSSWCDEWDEVGPLVTLSSTNIVTRELPSIVRVFTT